LPQQVIFSAIPPESWDIFIGVLWNRFGSETGDEDPITGQKFRSGTEQEFMAAYEQREKSCSGWPKIMFYQCTRPPASNQFFADASNQAQFEKVTEFFDRCRAGGVHPAFVKRYISVDEFEGYVREHLQTRLFEFGIANPG
jgi:hypothetical protein